MNLYKHSMILPSVPNLKDVNEKFENGTASLGKESFTFITQIGSGAFGKVYKVSSKITNKLYALKVLSKNQLNHLKLIDQLRNELSIFARCNHENIIRLFGAFEDQHYIYMIMELANDSNLFNKLKKAKKFSEKVAYEYLKDIIQALIYLHSQHPVILHRDLKPENILIHDGRCKLSDFGWSNVDAEFRNTFCGTPDYLAPEMILGSGHTEKLDIWTIGILMFELLHGKPPFSPKERIEDQRMMQKIIEKNILKGEIEFSDELSTEAVDCIKQLLNSQESLRPSARDILELPFFKKQGNTGKPELKGPGSNPGVSTNLDDQSTKETLTKRLNEYKQRMDILSQYNKKLLSQYELAESAQKITKRELDVERSRVKKLQEECAILKSLHADPANSKSQSVDEVANLKLLNSHKTEVGRYLFRRTQHIDRAVDEFFQDFVVEKQSALNPPSHLDALMKLECVFREYIKYKNIVEDKKLYNPYGGETKGAEPSRSDPRKGREEVRKLSPLITGSGSESAIRLDKGTAEFLDALEKYFKTDN